MFKKIGLSVIVLLLVAIGYVWIKFVFPLQTSADRNGPATAGRDYALQDDSRLTLPAPQAANYQAAPNPDMNLYWGELHVHTTESMDAIVFGTEATIEDAYIRAINFCEDWSLDDLVTPCLAPHAPYSLDTKQLKHVKNVANDLGVKIQMHVAESQFEIQHLQKIQRR